MYSRWEREEVARKAWRAGFFFGCFAAIGLFLLAGWLGGRGVFWLFH